MHPNRWLSPSLRRLLITQLCGLTLAVTAYPQATTPDASATQTQPPAKPARTPKPQEVASKKPAEEDDAIVMSPFEVMADNKGYQGSNTASGTRLNSRLEDLASPISVVTKQQLLDTAAVDLNDIFRTETNVEGLSQYTEISLDRGAIIDTASNNPEAANRIRGMGQANITSSGMSVSSAIPIDIYNVDSVEINRGANSNIFGIGSTSGTVNLNMATGNMSRDITKATLMTDSNGTLRETFDLNRVIFKNKLAIRVLGSNEDHKFQRKPAKVDTKRFTFALRAQPFKKTSIKVSYETYDEKASRPNQLTPVETISLWQQFGGYTWNPSNWTLYDNKGAAVGQFIGATTGGNGLNAATLRSTYHFLAAADDSGNQRPMMGYIDGKVAYFTGVSSWTFNRFGALPTATAPAGNNVYDQRGNQRAIDFELPAFLQNVPDIVNPATGKPFGMVNSNLDRYIGMHTAADKAMYDWSSVNLYAPNLQTKNSGVFRWELEQSLISTDRQQLAFQIGALYEEVESKSHNFIGNGGDGNQAVIFLDINQTLPNGDPNPGYLRPLMRGRQPQVYSRPEKNFTNKAQVAYMVDFTRNAGWTKWFGHHNLLGYGEYRERKFVPGALRYRSQVADTSDLVRSVGNSDSLNTRYYVGDATGYNFDDPTTAPPTEGVFPYTYWSTEYGGVGRDRLGDPQWRTTNVAVREVWFSQNAQRNENRALGMIWQGYFLKDRIIPTLGYRKDRIRFTGANPFTQQIQYGNSFYADTSVGVFDFPDSYNLTDFRTGAREQKGPTRTRGIVVKPFRWLHFSYNKSNSFEPANLAVDSYGDILPSPQGQSEDYGVRLSLLDEHLWVSVNRYEATTTNSRNGGAAVLAGRVIPFDVDTNETDPDNAFGGVSSANQQDLFDWYFFKIWGDTSAAANGQPNYNGTGDPVYLATHHLTTLQQVTDHVYDLMHYDKEIARKTNNVPSGTTRTATNDVTSKGTEIEINYRTRNWNLKITGAEKKTIDSNLAAGITKYIKERQPVLEAASYTNLTTGVTTSYWNSVWSGTQTHKDTWYTNVLSVYNPLVANLGKPRPQVRRYSMSATTSYNLVGMTHQKYLKNVRLGGTLSWASKASIGYGYGTPELDVATNVYWIRTLNPDKRFYDKARFSLDSWVAYDFRMFRDRIKSSVQLNVKNMLENGRLQGVATNTDGTAWAYRIIDPRLYQLTLNMEL